jgi:aminocarboxymuconate-semialdehyde decarboxylase
MPNRRVFLSRAGAAAAGIYLAGRGLPVRAQSRKEVFIGGRRVKVIDIHAHCDFPELAPVIRGTRLADADLSRTLGPARLAEMDALGIDVAALSVNRFWWYAADRELARDIVRINDETMASWCARHPDRFVGLSSPALQFPELAAEQLDFAVNELGARGASVGGHVMGEVPTSAKYDVFWAKAEALGVPVFMHPDGADNMLQPNALDGPGGLGNIIGNPLETTLFLSRMIFNGTLDRFPELVLCAAHGGGYLPSYLGRSEVACERNNARCENRRKPSEYFKTQIMVDSMVFDEEGIRHLVAVAGAGQVVFGSDIPHGWPDTIELIVNSPSLSNDEKEAILGGNLARLLKISA